MKQIKDKILNPHPFWSLYGKNSNSYRTTLCIYWKGLS